MRLIVGFMFLVGVALTWFLYKFSFSPVQEAILLSLIVGMVVFIIVSGLIYSNSGSKKNKNLDSEWGIKKRKKRAHTMGFIVMIISIFLFFSFYLYFRSLMGNDLLVSRDVDKQNFWTQGVGDVMRTPNKIINIRFSQKIENGIMRGLGMVI